MAKSFLNNTNYTRGLRNNNPGNLVTTSIAWQGKIPLSQNRDKDKKFEQFYELRYGIRALMRDLNTDFKKGQNTITSLINSYAPDFENDTEAYIKSVAKALGVDPNVKMELTEEIMIGLCTIIIAVENGNKAAELITASDYNEALAISGLNLKKKKAR